MKRALICLLAAIAAFGSVFAQESGDWFMGKPIKEIRFEGLEYANKKSVDSIVKDYIGSPFTYETYSELQKRIYLLEFFDPTSIESEALDGDPLRSTVIIRFKVKEYPAIETVKIEGNATLRTSEILDVVTLKRDDIYTSTKADLDKIAVHQLYVDKGYPNVYVETGTIPDTKRNRVTLVVKVTEGTQISVKTIKFSGNASVTEGALKGEMGLKEQGLFQPGAFNEFKLEEDKQKIELYYKGKGFVDAKVTDVARETVEEKGKSKLALVFSVAEGKQYVYDGMSFEGNLVFSDEFLSSLVRQKPGAILNYRKLTQDQQRIMDQYVENGYIFNTITMKERRDEGRNAIAYVFDIVEFDRAHIEHVLVKGNDKTKDGVILREIPIESGDVFSKTKVLDGMRNLYNLQFFSAVNPEFVKGSSDLLMDLVFNVEEQSTADIQFGVTLAGIGSTKSGFPLVGQVSWNDRNFMGNGQTFSVGVNVAQTSQDLTFGFKENWLFGKRWSGGLDLSFKHAQLKALQDIAGPQFSYDDPDRVPDPYASKAEYEAAGKVVPDAYYMLYDTLSASLGLSTGYTWKTPVGDIGVGGGYALSFNDKFYDPALNRPFDRTISANLNTWLLANSLNMRVYLNRLDISFDPSSGYYASQKFSLNGFFESELSRFIRSDSRADGYLTLFNLPLTESWSWKTVAGLHSSFSALMPRLGEAVAYIQDSEKLSIDGTFVGRGWSSLSAIRGTQRWESSFEIRMPIVPQIISLDGFVDAAALVCDEGILRPGDTVSYGSGSSMAGVGLGNFAFSVGAGLRFVIPQFPFRLYLARRFTVEDGAVLWATPSSGSFDFVLSISQPLN